MSPAALELSGVEAAYGPFRALFGIDLTVPTGGAVALLGSNGAGKTTVARVATGLLRPSRGEVTVVGSRLTGARTYRFARAGVAHAPEGRSVLATLTVEDNLLLTSAVAREGASALERAYGVFPKLAERRSQLAGTLSGGEQRMLALAVVFVESPAVLVADELSLGLAPIVVDDVYHRLADIRSTGTALLVVEQHIHHALELCESAVVLDHGRVAWSGPSSEAPAAIASLTSPTRKDVRGSVQP